MCIAYKRTARSQGSAEDGAGPLGKNSRKHEALCKSLTEILFSSAAWLPCDCRERSLTPAQRDLWSKPCYKAPWSCGTNLFQVKGLESSAGSTNPVRLESKFIKPCNRCWLLTQLPKQVKQSLLITHRSMVWSLSHHPVLQESQVRAGVQGWLLRTHTWTLASKDIKTNQRATQMAVGHLWPTRQAGRIHLSPFSHWNAGIRRLFFQQERNM